MPEKPSYLGLLNAIAVGECRGHALLKAWAGVTGNVAVKEALTIVAIREQEHAAAFEKRLCELGFSVREKRSEEFERQLELAKSNAPDRRKFEELLGYDRDSESDPLSEIFKDHSIDIATGELLGRFIAEERDSERRLREVYGKLGPERSAADPTLDDITERLDRLTRTLEELKALRRTA